MTLKELYDTLDGDYDEMMLRLFSEEYVLKYFAILLKDETFSELTAAVADGRLEDAFRAAHTMKGVCLNLGLGRSAELFSQLTETLRPLQENTETAELFGLAADGYQHDLDAIRAFLNK